MITVYGKPACSQCTATQRRLKQARVDYKYVDVLEDPKGLEKIKELGYLQAPVVVTKDKHWGGFNPEEIDAYVATLT